MTTEQLDPAVKAEIEQQVIEAEIENLKTGGVQFAGDAIADGALLSDGNLAGSLQMASDPGSRDYVTLYSTVDGLPSRILMNMLGKKLAQKLPDGHRAWSTSPTVAYAVGDLKCLLHEDHPRRAEWDGIGLKGKTCTKSNIPSGFEVRQHMVHRHAQEWAVMEEARATEEREEERAFRRAMIAQSQPAIARRPAKDEKVLDI